MKDFASKLKRQKGGGFRLNLNLSQSAKPQESKLERNALASEKAIQQEQQQAMQRVRVR